MAGTATKTIGQWEAEERRFRDGQTPDDEGQLTLSLDLSTGAIGDALAEFIQKAESVEFAEGVMEKAKAQVKRKMQERDEAWTQLRALYAQAQAGQEAAK